jgi:hypothetical protein
VQEHDSRPLLGPPIDALIAALISSQSELHGLTAGAVLVVALSAHGNASASVRPFLGSARRVVVDGLERHWEMGLRPLFFRRGDPASRLATIVHELLHLDARELGLRRERRHDQPAGALVQGMAQRIARRFLDEGDLDRVAALGHSGEVLMRQWLRRPTPSTRTRRFSDRDLFVGPVPMKTSRAARTVWW